MSENPFKGRKFTTPVGTAGFVALTQPFTMGDKTDYKCTLRFEDPDDIADIENLLQGLAVEDKADRGKKCNLPMSYEEDEQTGEPTGAVLVRFKAMAGGIAKSGKNAGKEWSHDILIRQPEEGTIGAGSKLAIQFMARQTAYQGKHFLQLKPVRVKVLELVEYSGDGGGDDGFFDDVEGGIETKSEYVTAATPVAPPTPAPRVRVGGDDEDVEAPTPKGKVNF